MKIHENAASQLLGHDLDSRKLLRNMLKELRKLHCYRLQEHTVKYTVQRNVHNTAQSFGHFR